MPKLRNGSKGDSNPGSLGSETGVHTIELPRSTKCIVMCVSESSDNWFTVMLLVGTLEF